MRIDGIEILCDDDIARAFRQMFQRGAEALKLDEQAPIKFEKTIDEDVYFFKKGWYAKGIVAARLYIISLLSGQARSQREIAAACRTTEDAIRKCYKKMKGGWYDANRPKLDGKEMP